MRTGEERREGRGTHARVNEPELAPRLLLAETLKLEVLADGLRYSDTRRTGTEEEDLLVLEGDAVQFL